MNSGLKHGKIQVPAGYRLSDGMAREKQLAVEIDRIVLQLSDKNRLAEKFGGLQGAYDKWRVSAESAYKLLSEARRQWAAWVREKRESDAVELLRKGRTIFERLKRQGVFDEDYIEPDEREYFGALDRFFANERPEQQRA